jgi:hypothetical protein
LGALPLGMPKLRSSFANTSKVTLKLKDGIFLIYIGEILGV